jgi:hypothetical protein
MGPGSDTESACKSAIEDDFWAVKAKEQLSAAFTPDGYNIGINDSESYENSRMDAVTD